VFGFTPWIDFERRLTGVVLVKDTLARIWTEMVGLEQAAGRCVVPTGVACLGVSTYACTTPIVHNTTAVPKPQALNFGFASYGEPANSPGVLVVGSAAKTSGWLFGNFLVYLDIAWPWTSFPVISDAAGSVTVPIVLPGSLKPGSKLYSQFFWPKPASCGGYSYTGAASNALVVTVQ
jgi:hypothetical protein